jgi:class 3 adenylate cyclase
MHSGDVVGGIIETHKFVYDIWSDTVNIASRMGSHGLPNCIQISAAIRLHIHEHFHFEPHGCVDIKGKGPLGTFILVGRPDTSASAAQKLPAPSRGDLLRRTIAATG